uniref:UPF3B regulator of nonsense mediated mRNA decay n=1 Tax=Cyclopterus lumpus TaxID=8103 RepID=A0A8C2WUV8_CYCLU
MKEDKENARPKERKLELNCEDGEKTEKSKERKEIVIRRLPPKVDYFEFFSNDASLYPHLFARAYINFKNQEDIVLFRDRFDGYVFIDTKGQEYPAIVEFAPFSKDYPDYKKFLEFYNGDDDKLASTPETLDTLLDVCIKKYYIFSLQAKKTTPLLDFLKNKQRIREEKKEDRRRRELERKRLRDEERRKWREEERRKRKDTDKMKRHEKPLEKDKDQVKEEPKIKLLKKPDRSDDADSDKSKEKAKKPDRPNKEDRSMGGADHKRRQHIENKEDRGGRKLVGRKEFRERDTERDRERERERLQREKERIRRQDENRRRRRDRQDGENSFRKREEDVKKDKERAKEKKKGENIGDSTHSERPERPTKDYKKEESSKRDRLRNKDRPAIQLYQPGARSRRGGGGGGGGAESNSADRKPDAETEKVADKGDD